MCLLKTTLVFLLYIFVCVQSQRCADHTLSLCKCSEYEVDCANSGIKFVPKGIPITITHLYLDNNNITVLVNDSFESGTSTLLHLKVLNLKKNFIKSIHASAFHGLRSLEELNLYGNRLQYADSFPKSVFLPLSRTLRMLDIRMNLLEDIQYVNYPVSVAELHLLKELKMDCLRNKLLPKEYSHLKHLQKLDFSESRKELFFVNNNTFESVTSLHIEEIHFAGLNLKVIGKGTFSKLLSLRKLDLSNNPELSNHVSDIAPSLNNTNITALYLNNTGLGLSTTSAILKKFCGLHLKELTLDGNYIHAEQLEPIFGRCFPKLKLLSLAENYLLMTRTLIADVMHLKYLVGFNVSSQIAQVSGRSKRQVHVCQNGMACPTALPPRLRWIDASHNAVYDANVPEIVFVTNFTLDSFKASYSGLQTMIFPAYCPWNIVPRMTLVDLGHNGLQCINATFFNESLTGCNWDSLEYFYLGSNNLGQIGNNVCNQDKTNVFGFLKPLAKLKLLDLSDNKIFSDQKLIPLLALSELKILDLSSNGFYNFSFTINTFTKLVKLNLALNNLRQLPDSLMVQLDKLQKLKSAPIELDLSGNPLSCDCASLDFLQWMKMTDVYLINNKTYQCKYSDGTTGNLDELPFIVAKLEAECFGTQWLQLYVGVVIIVYFLIIIFSLAYRVRYEIWFLCIKLQINRKKYLGIVNRNKYRYSAFVCSERRDSAKFVIPRFLPNLETAETNLKFCIAQRNFLVGRSIIDNIVIALDNSRKAILIISKHFLKGKWCKEELRMAHQTCLDRGENIIVCIFMPDIKPDQLPPTLLMITKTVTCIKWPLDPRAQKVFWVKLQEGLDPGDPNVQPNDIL